MKILAFCAAVAGVTLAPLAVAASPFETTTVVRTSQRGLDLTSQRGAAMMLMRLDRAALRACGASDFSVPAVREGARRSACYDDGMSAAVGSLGAPAVEALYARRSSHAPG